MRALGLFKRAAAVLAGLVLGMLLVAGADPWRKLLPKNTPDPAPSAPIQRERAPDPRA